MAKFTVDLLDQSCSPSKTILLLAWPAILEQLLQTMVSYVDTAMVGSMGADATAAVAMTTSLSWLVNGLMNAAALGFSVQISRNIGSGGIKQAERIVRQAMLALFAGGLFFTVLMELLAGPMPLILGAEPWIAPHSTNYLRIVSSVQLFNTSMVFCGGILRGAGDTKTPMQVNLLANLTNIIGNFFLIFPSRDMRIFGRTFQVWGAGWGVEGAAAATAFSGVLSGILLFMAIFSPRFTLELQIKPTLSQIFKPDKTILKTALAVGSPAALERIVMSSGQLVLTGIVVSISVTAFSLALIQRIYRRYGTIELPELLERAKKELPNIYSMMSEGKFGGSKDGLYQLRFPPDKQFYIGFLMADARRAQIEDILTKEGGQPARFEAVGENTAPAQEDARRLAEQDIQALSAVFGRQNIIVTGGDKPKG